MQVAVAIFAHNESDRIGRCLTSVLRGLDRFDYSVHVLANGCTDNTASRARQAPSTVHVHEIAIGDKANAWNFFVHELATDADTFIFTDGDCWADIGAIPALIDALNDNPTANGASAVYAHAPDIKPWTFNGNLYALRGSFVRRIRESGYRMPRGLVGEDGSLGHVVLLDLDPAAEWDYGRLVVCQEARFFADRSSPFSIAYWRNQHHRRLRYSRRYFENKMLEHVIKHHGIRAIPDTVADLYRMAGHVCRLRWRGFDTPYDWRSWRTIRAHH